MTNPPDIRVPLSRRFRLSKISSAVNGVSRTHASRVCGFLRGSWSPSRRRVETGFRADNDHYMLDTRKINLWAEVCLPVWREAHAQLLE
jgi:hypothetical protein